MSEKKNNQFDLLFEQFKQDDPEWEKYMTDSTFYELMDWYDHKQGNVNEECNSDKAHDFATYIWEKIVEENTPEMTLHKQVLGGYMLINMSKEDLHAFIRIINSAYLPERRYWHKIKEQIKKQLSYE